MKNVLIINGHQYYDTVAQGKLTQMYIDSANEFFKEQRFNVKNSVVESAYDVKEEVEKFGWADYILFQYPVYWMGVPWITKKYIDEIFSVGQGSRKEEKLELYLGGIKDMHKLPDMMFVLDAVKEKIAIAEARRLGITVVAPLDTNCDPDVVDLPIPGNDDAIRSIHLFCNEMAAAMNEGKAVLAESGVETSGEPISQAEQDELIAEAVAEGGEINFGEGEEA